MAYLALFSVQREYNTSHYNIFLSITLITFNWLEKRLDKKPAPIEVIISLFTWSKQKWLF